jgi:hypothetical protein
VRFTITPLGGAGRGVTKIVDAIVRYLTPRTPEPPPPGSPGPGGGAGALLRRWRRGTGPLAGPGAHAPHLAGLVTEADLAKVLATAKPSQPSPHPPVDDTVTRRLAHPTGELTARGLSDPVCKRA